MAHHLGVLATTAGDPTAAADHFRSALAAHERWGAAAWASKSRSALDRLAASTR
jgi:hypothetical protein